MKKILLTILVAAAITACNSNKNDQAKSQESSSSTEQAASESNIDQPAADDQMNPLEAFAGTWTQNPPKATEAKSALSLAKMELDLNADGTFEGKSEMMGMNNSVQGTWKLTGNTVELDWDGIALSLIADGSMREISDMKNGVTLTK